MRWRPFPLLLIALGGFFLLGSLGIVPREELRHLVHAWWPLLLIGLGVAALLRPAGCGCRDRRCKGSRPDERPAPEARSVSGEA